MSFLKSKPIIANKAIKEGVNRLLEVYDAQAIKNISEETLGQFLAVYAYRYQDKHHKLNTKQIVHSIKLAKINAIVFDGGEVLFNEVSNTPTNRRVIGKKVYKRLQYYHERSFGKWTISRGRIMKRRRVSTKTAYPSNRDNNVCYQSAESNNTGKEPVVIKTNLGTTIYYIQNLHIHLTADVVQQLNINPQQVINQLHEQIREEINKVETKQG